MDNTASSPCSLNNHSFSGTAGETKVNFQVLQLQDQLLVWAGTGPPSLSELAVAVPLRDQPSTKLLGQNDLSSGLATRLSKKLNKQVFVSYNLPKDEHTLPQVEQRINKEIKDNPDKF